jgi:hypothetical protein
MVIFPKRGGLGEGRNLDNGQIQHNSPTASKYSTASLHSISLSSNLILSSYRAYVFKVICSLKVVQQFCIRCSPPPFHPLDVTTHNISGSAAPRPGHCAPVFLRHCSSLGGVQTRVTSRDIHGERSGIRTEFSPSFLGFPLCHNFTITPQLSPVRNVCYGPAQAAHYYIPGLQVAGFIPDTTLGPSRTGVM